MAKKPTTPVPSPARTPALEPTPAAPISAIAGKLFGLVKDPTTRFGYEFYFLVTATINEAGEIVDVEKSSQSWFMWEALHKMERATELSLIDIQKGPEVPK
jgi:hypothetical protein